MANSWIDADVYYIGADGQTLITKGYGMSDGGVQGTVKVYCREFWEAIHESGDPAQADWTSLLEQNDLAQNDGDPILLESLEERLAAGLKTGYGTRRLVIVRAANNDAGYTARGFNLISEY